MIPLILVGIKRWVEAFSELKEVVISGMESDKDLYPSAVIEHLQQAKVKQTITPGFEYEYVSPTGLVSQTPIEGYEYREYYLPVEYKSKIRIKLYDVKNSANLSLMQKMVGKLEHDIILNLSPTPGNVSPVEGETEEEYKLRSYTKFAEDYGITYSQLMDNYKFNLLTNYSEAEFDILFDKTSSYTYSDSGKPVWGNIIEFWIYYYTDRQLKRSVTSTGLTKEIKVNTTKL